jgi:spoIIIJ-associated protein
MDNTKIKSLIEGLLGQLGVKFDAVEIKDDGLTGRTVFIIKSTDSGLLIGERGETFQALSHLIKRMASKGVEESSIQFAIDVNDYQSSMVDKLKLQAKMFANRARDLKSNIEMEPMTSYERLVVHGALTGEANVKTESVGEGRERRVVIKYIAG